MMDLFLTNMQIFTSEDITWWTGVVWITYGLLCFYQDFHSDGTHSPQGIHLWASDVMVNFSKSIRRNKHLYVMNGLRVSTFSANFHFWENYFFVLIHT